MCVWGGGGGVGGHTHTHTQTDRKTERKRATHCNAVTQHNYQMFWHFNFYSRIPTFGCARCNGRANSRPVGVLACRPQTAVQRAVGARVLNPVLGARSAEEERRPHQHQGQAHHQLLVAFRHHSFSTLSLICVHSEMLRL